VIVAAPRAATDPLVRHLGPSNYEPTWRAMRDFTAARSADTPDEIWLTEHPPIYTLGLAGRREHLLRENGIETLKVDRGGQVTYHGPGQLVVYTLIDLARAGLGIRDTVRRFERAVIRWLETLGIAAHAKLGAPGVYTMQNGADAKIAALGLKVSRGCTYHGLSVNVAMDLSPFSDIDPCGYRGLAVTQLRDLGVVSTVDQAGAGLAPLLARSIVDSGSR
jgi:lipoyl(octanoyl) transferase